MRRSKALFLATNLASLLVAAEAAQACSIITDGHAPTYRELMKDARRVVTEAAAIVDGEVVRPDRGQGSPAIVRAERVLKGPAQAEFKVGAGTSCDAILDRTGLRARFILYGGPEVFTTPLDQGNAVYEDRVLGSDRRKVWPWREGEAPRP